MFLYQDLAGIRIAFLFLDVLRERISNCVSTCIRGRRRYQNTDNNGKNHEQYTIHGCVDIDDGCFLSIHLAGFFDDVKVSSE